MAEPGGPQQVEAGGGGPVLWWCRRDLRLDDNPALHAALQRSSSVIPVFIWAPEEEGQFQPGRYSRWWTKHSVLLFKQLLEQLGSRLVIRRAQETSRALQQLVADTGATAVYFNHLYDPISLVRDHEVKQVLSKAGIECRSFNADLLYEPWEVLDEGGQPLTSFDSFWSRIMTMPYPPPFPLHAPTRLPTVDSGVASKDINALDWFMTPDQEASSDQLRFKWRPGVEGAVEKLEAFLSGRLQYFEHDRAKVDRESTSQLSPWIHIGTISVRYVFYRVCQKQAEASAQGRDLAQSCKDFLQQVGYREYSRYLSFHFPFIHERALLAHLRACPWRLDQAAYKAWRQGQTGYPLVDAAMRQLSSTGWCHNRMRVVAASFMVKNLMLPWQWGLKHFWDAQMDADLECDALGWQYVSGGMADAHPFSYIIDLDKEARRFDPDGEYVRRWLPVLARLPTQYIHAPWRAPPAVLAMADVELGGNYPEPVITAEESQQFMAEACKVLDQCAAAATQSAGATGTGTGTGSRSQQLRHPYRAPVEPLSRGAMGASAGLNGSKGSKPTSGGTGTGTAYNMGQAVGSGSGTGIAGHGTGTGAATNTGDADGSGSLPLLGLSDGAAPAAAGQAGRGLGPAGPGAGAAAGHAGSKRPQGEWQPLGSTAALQPSSDLDTDDGQAEASAGAGGRAGAAAAAAPGGQAGPGGKVRRLDPGQEALAEAAAAAARYQAQALLLQQQQVLRARQQQRAGVYPYGGLGAAEAMGLGAAAAGQQSSRHVGLGLEQGQHGGRGGHHGGLLGMRMPYYADQEISGASDSDEDMGSEVSEEVVSNTVGLSAPQASGWSHMPVWGRAAAAVMDTARPQIRPMGLAEAEEAAAGRGSQEGEHHAEEGEGEAGGDHRHACSMQAEAPSGSGRHEGGSQGDVERAGSAEMEDAQAGQVQGGEGGLEGADGDEPARHGLGWSPQHARTAGAGPNKQGWQYGGMGEGDRLMVVGHGLEGHGDGNGMVEDEGEVQQQPKGAAAHKRVWLEMGQ